MSTFGLDTLEDVKGLATDEKIVASLNNNMNSESFQKSTQLKVESTSPPASSPAVHSARMMRYMY